MDKSLETFSAILEAEGIRLKDVYLNSKGYINGIYESIKIIKEYAKKGSSIIDFGCGTGFISFLLKSDYKIIPYERIGEDGEIEEFKKKRTAQQRIYKALGFFDPTRIFEEVFSHTDSFLLHAVYEHLEDRQKFLRNTFANLCSGGHLFIFRLPQKHSYSEAITGSHKILLSRSEAIKEIVDAGFIIERVEYTDFLVWSIPIFQGLYNLMFSLFNLIDKFCLSSPLKRFSHNLTIIARKP
jgi:2-polyprenyl-3-methyl-5-hydroxy-6-metoxy-1,4-benzoquinol methylase